MKVERVSGSYYYTQGFIVQGHRSRTGHLDFMKNCIKKDHGNETTPKVSSSDIPKVEAYMNTSHTTRNLGVPENRGIQSKS